MAFKRSISSLFSKSSKSEESNKSSFTLVSDGAVMALLTQTDGKILVGGIFKTLCGKKRVGIGRLNPDCTLDAEFNPLADNHVSVISLQQDGKILIGGDFSTIHGQVRRNIARLNSDGSLDPSFNLEIIFIAGIAGIRNLFPLRTTGNFVVTGRFPNIKNKGFRKSCNIIILNDKGAVEDSYKAGSWGYSWDGQDETLWYNRFLNGIIAVTEQTDGKLVMGGGFTGLNGDKCAYMGRLNTDGTIDKSFSADLGRYVTAIIPQEEGKFLVGGYFRDVGRYKRKYLVRLNHDGSLDDTLPPWNPTHDRPVKMMISRSNGTIVVLQKDWMMENKYSIMSLDPSDLRTLSSFDFKINGGGEILTLVVQDNGGIVIGGAITKFEGQKCNNILRLNPDGTLDTSFT